MDGACVSAADSLEAATRIALAVAEAAILARVDTVVVHIGASTESGFLRGSNERGRNAAFLARVLQYLETPPCLRRALVPAHADLAMVGSLPSESRVDFMPHHLRAHREGAYFARASWSRNTHAFLAAKLGRESLAFTTVRHLSPP